MELALVVGKAYLPGITADSVRNAVAQHPKQFYVSPLSGVFATEQVLEHLIAQQFVAGNYAPGFK